MGNYENKEIGWDDEVEIGEGGSFILLPAGDYDFTVETFDRARFDGSRNDDGSVKTPACNKAILKLRINGSEGSTLITENLLLYEKMEWKIAEFFQSIGEKVVNGKVRMNWSAVPGATGRAKVGIRTYTKEGEEKKTNEIKKFLPKEPKKFQPGKF